MSDLLEFDEVRKLSAEVVSRISPFIVTKEIIMKFENFYREKNYPLAKVYLFSLCNHAMIYGNELQEMGIVSVVKLLFEILEMRTPLGNNGKLIINFVC